MKRRDFLRQAGSLTGGALLGNWGSARATARATIAVVGGGMGGVVAAARLKRRLPQARVVVVEKNTSYFADMYGNLALVNAYPMQKLGYSYDALRRIGVEWVEDEAQAIEEKHLVLPTGKIAFDFAVVATGVSFDRARFVDGVDDTNLHRVPHGMAGAQSAKQLQSQIASLRDGDTMAIIPAPNPSRCPPAAYSRAGLIAEYMEKNLPQSKVLIFDSKNKFSLQTYFDSNWHSHYRDRIEWFSNDAGGLVEAIDVEKKIIYTEFGEEAVGAICYVPPQFAGVWLQQSDLCDESGWCPVHAQTMESTRRAGIYVIGDAAASEPLPKAGLTAVGHAHIAADAIYARVQELKQPLATVDYVCYSHISTRYAFWERGQYAAEAQGFRRIRQELSPLDVSAQQAELTAKESEDFFIDAFRSIFSPV